MSGDPAPEASIGADGRDEHEPGGRFEGLGRDGPQRQWLGATEAVGGPAVELLLVSHGMNIDQHVADL